MMNYSLSEIRSIVKRAARGAQYSWGIAEEAGYVASWLEAHNIEWVAAIACLLELADRDGLCSPDTDRPDWNNSGRSLCPLQMGCFVLDLGRDFVDQGRLEVGPVAVPLLLAPFIHHLANNGEEHFHLKWPDGDIWGGEGKILISPPALRCDRASRLTLTIGDINHEMLSAQCPPPDQSPDQLPDLEAAWRVVGSFGERMLVPESESSRLSGAGDGAVIAN